MEKNINRKISTQIVGGLLAAAALFSGCQIDIGANSPKGKYLMELGGDGRYALGSVANRGCLVGTVYDATEAKIQTNKKEMVITPELVSEPPLVLDITRQHAFKAGDQYTRQILASHDCILSRQ